MAASRLSVWTTGLMLTMVAVARSQEPDRPTDSPPLRYEVLINGENFAVEAGEFTTLKSQTKPGVTYRVAVRVAQYQPWRLNTVGLVYHRGFEVQDDRDEDLRTATFRHALGFAMVISDLGGTLKPDARAKALRLLVDATETSLRRGGAKNIEQSRPTTRKFDQTDGLGLILSYDLDGESRRTLAYLLTSEKFACTCVVQYATEDQENVLPLVKPTLESVVRLAESE